MAEELHDLDLMLAQSFGKTKLKSFNIYSKNIKRFVKNLTGFNVPKSTEPPVFTVTPDNTDQK
jgi:hypothetical protein